MGCKVDVDSFVMEQVVEHAVHVTHCHIMGHGGKVKCWSARPRHPPPTQVEFGGQFVAKFSKFEKQVIKNESVG